MSREIIYSMICGNCGYVANSSLSPNSKTNYLGNHEICRHCGIPMFSLNKSDDEYEDLYKEKYGIALKDVSDDGMKRHMIFETFISNEYIREHFDEMDPHAIEHMRRVNEEENAQFFKDREARHNAPRCPHCKAMDIHPQQKGFSLGKAAAGALVAGPVGVVAGMHGASDEVYKCNVCGKKFKFKDAFYFG